MDGAPTEEIIRVVKLCPTQALTFEYNKDIEIEKQQSASAAAAEIDAEIRIMEDGPLVLKGNFKIFDTKGNELRHLRMTSLCRCGASNDLPFCDGTHRKIGFTGK